MFEMFVTFVNIYKSVTRNLQELSGHVWCSLWEYLQEKDIFLRYENIIHAADKDLKSY